MKTKKFLLQNLGSFRNRKNGGSAGEGNKISKSHFFRQNFLLLKKISPFSYSFFNSLQKISCGYLPYPLLLSSEVSEWSEISHFAFSLSITVALLGGGGEVPRAAFSRGAQNLCLGDGKFELNEERKIISWFPPS